MTFFFVSLRPGIFFWHYRNDWVHNSLLTSFDTQCRSIISYIADFTASLAPPTSSRAPPSSSWQPPPQSFIKINFDAAFIPSSAMGACGGLALNASGLVLAAFASPISSCSSALHAEAFAFRLAIIFARTMGYSQVIFEGDNAQVIGIMNSTQLDHSSAASLLNDAKAYLAPFDSFSFSHVPRSLNNTTDSLAKLGLSLHDTFYWFDNFSFSCNAVM